ncbi:hypothetical protein D3C84_623340 [compost metagenome]
MFAHLLAEFKKSGLDEKKSIVPLALDGSILNGAHRSSVAIYLDQSVASIKTDIAPHVYDYKFFKARGVSVEMLDIAAQTFSEYDSNSFIALLWPAAKDQEKEVEKKLCKVVYKKKVSLNYNGAHNLLAEAYEGEPWLGSAKENYPGIKNKLVECFPDFKDVRVYLIQAECLDDVLKIKENIRDLFNIGKHAIHMTDTKEETLRIGRLLFSQCGVHFLNHAKPNTYVDLKDKINEFKTQVSRRGLDINDYVLDSGVVMAAYGLRKADDIDYLTRSKVIKTELIEHHGRELPYHEVEECELVDNPQYYFYFKDVKLLSLAQVYKMKNNRADNKDQLDVMRIGPLTNPDSTRDQLNLVRYRAYFIRAKGAGFIRKCIVSLLKFIGLYNHLRRLYRKKFKK